MKAKSPQSVPKSQGFDTVDTYSPSHTLYSSSENSKHKGMKTYYLYSCVAVDGNLTQSSTLRDLDRSHQGVMMVVVVHQ